MTLKVKLQPLAESNHYYYDYYYYFYYYIDNNSNNSFTNVYTFSICFEIKWPVVEKLMPVLVMTIVN